MRSFSAATLDAWMRAALLRRERKDEAIGEGQDEDGWCAGHAERLEPTYTGWQAHESPFGFEEERPLNFSFT